MNQATKHKRRQSRRRSKRRRSKPVVTIRFAGQSIYIAPPCNDLTVFCTERLVPNPTKPRLLEPLFALDRRLLLADGDDEPSKQTVGVSMPAGLLDPVCVVLDRAGYDVQFEDRPVDLQEVAQSARRRGGVQDPAVLEFVRTKSRGIVRIGQGVDAAVLCAQIAKAWPQMKIAVVGCRKKTVAHAAHMLKDALGDLQVTHVSNFRPERIARVTVTTFSEQGSVNLNERRLILVLDPVELLGRRSRILLDCSPTARLIGFLPRDCTMSRRDADEVHAWFGFDRLVVPSHGEVAREVIVVRSSVRGGARIDVGDDVVALKRRGVWHNRMRNRRIAGLVQLLRHRKLKELDQRFRSVARAVRGRQINSVVVLVENVEHAETLHELVPDASITTAFERTVATVPADQGVAVQIATATAFSQLNLQDVDVVIRVDAGPGSQPVCVTAHKIVARNSNGPLVLVDLSDETHPELRKWAKRRLEAYCDAGFTVDGEQHTPVNRFLAQRPQRGGR